MILDICLATIFVGFTIFVVTVFVCMALVMAVEVVKYIKEYLGGSCG